MFVLTDGSYDRQSVDAIMKQFYGDAFQMHGFANRNRDTGAKAWHIAGLYDSKFEKERVSRERVVLIDDNWKHTYATATLGFSVMKMDETNLALNKVKLMKLLNLVDEAALPSEGWGLGEDGIVSKIYRSLICLVTPPEKELAHEV